MLIDQYPFGSRRPSKPKRDSRRARTLTYDQVDLLIARVAQASNAPHSDRLKLALSFYGGLRVSEIAQLTIADMTDATGEVDTSFTVRASIAKNGRHRTVPMHPKIADGLKKLRQAHPDATQIAFSSRYGRPKPQTVAATTKWFARVFESAGLQGCSSHSGRRTYITHLARAANTFGNSLADIQRIVGHANLETTQRYIDPTDSVAALIASLGSLPAASPTHQPQLCA